MADICASLNVAGVSIDTVRNITGYFASYSGLPEQAGGWASLRHFSGAFAGTGPFFSKNATGVNDVLPDSQMGATLDPGRVVPVGAVNRPRSLGVLACSYMGVPAL